MIDASNTKNEYERIYLDRMYPFFDLFHSRCAGTEKVLRLINNFTSDIT